MGTVNNYKAENFGENWIEIYLPFECEIHHCFPRAKPDTNKYSVLIHYTEPSQLKMKVGELRAHHKMFDLILTNDESLMDLPNASLAFFGGCWVSVPPKCKRFEISFLYSNGIGHENIFNGYQARRYIWSNKEKIILPKSFYTSVRRPPESIEDLRPYPFEGKDKIFESMFSFVVENEFINNYFTEKIVDCFATYTIPVYLGCPNITKFFASDGIIIAKKAEDLICIANNLNVNDYWSRLAVMRENYLKSKKYWDILKNMQNYILAAAVSR